MLRVGIFSKCLLVESIGSKKLVAFVVPIESIHRIDYMKDTEAIEVAFKGHGGLNMPFYQTINKVDVVYNYRDQTANVTDRELLYYELILKLANKD